MNRNRAFVAMLLVSATLMGCAAINQAVTPSLQIVQDPFDGATIVRQPAVSAAAGPADAWHTLGFEWSTKSPDAVFIMAGVRGIDNVLAVAFNADSQVIDQIEAASLLTDYGDWSERRFKMSWDDFVTVANARSVKLRISRINEYTVSSFGPVHAMATVNGKFAPFLAKVSQLRQ